MQMDRLRPRRVQVSHLWVVRRVFDRRDAHERACPHLLARPRNGPDVLSNLCSSRLLPVASTTHSASSRSADTDRLLRRHRRADRVAGSRQQISGSVSLPRAGVRAVSV